MDFALINNGVVVNVVSSDHAPTIEELVYDPPIDISSIVRIDELSPYPGIDWTYDGTNFSPPS